MAASIVVKFRQALISRANGDPRGTAARFFRNIGTAVPNTMQALQMGSMSDSQIITLVSSCAARKAAAARQARAARLFLDGEPPVDPDGNLLAEEDLRYLDVEGDEDDADIAEVMEVYYAPDGRIWASRETYLQDQRRAGYTARAGYKDRVTGAWVEGKKPKPVKPVVERYKAVRRITIGRTRPPVPED